MEVLKSQVEAIAALDLGEEAVVAARLEEFIDGFVWSIGVVRWGATHDCPSAGLVGAAVAHNPTTTTKFLSSDNKLSSVAASTYDIKWKKANTKS